MGTSLGTPRKGPRWRDLHDRRNHRSRTPAQLWWKRGIDSNQIGRSRGGLTTKIHACVDALGNAVRLILTPGQRHDITQAAELTASLRDCELLGDKGYDSDELVNDLKARNVRVGIPSKRNRKHPRQWDRHSYKSRHLIENFFCRIKGSRRVATRYDKTARSYLAMVTLASILAWLL